MQIDLQHKASCSIDTAGYLQGIQIVSLINHAATCRLLVVQATSSG